AACEFSHCLSKIVDALNVPGERIAGQVYRGSSACTANESMKWSVWPTFLSNNVSKIVESHGFQISVGGRVQLRVCFAIERKSACNRRESSEPDDLARVIDATCRSRMAVREFDQRVVSAA